MIEGLVCYVLALLAVMALGAIGGLLSRMWAP